MSAFICNNTTYQDILSGFHQFITDEFPCAKNAIAKLLSSSGTEAIKERYIDIIRSMYSLNVHAVNRRYNENHSSILAKDDMQNIALVNKNISPYQFMKSLECWVYQTSESELFENTAIYVLTNEIIGAIAKDIVHGNSLYKAASWN